jgi:activating signal cointegrator complex subunit 3
MKNQAIDMLKNSHPQYNSSAPMTLESFTFSIDRLWNRNDLKNKSGYENLKVSQKRKDEDQRLELIDKYSKIQGSEEKRGNLLNRYLTLTEASMMAVNFEFKDKKMDDIKEITRLCKIMNINFGKKNPNEALFGVFIVIFDCYCKVIDELSEETLFAKLKIELSDFELVLTNEIYERIKSLFTYVMEKSLFIMMAQVYSEHGRSEFLMPVAFPFEDIENCHQAKYELEDDEVTFDRQFDDLQLPNEYATKLVMEDGSSLWVRSGKAKEREDEAGEEQAPASFGTSEEVANLEKIEDLTLVDKKGNLGKVREEDEDSAALTYQVKDDTKFRKFYAKYQKLLCKEEYWQTNLFNCLEMIADMTKPTDLFFDQIMSYMGGEMEPTLFLMEHREEVVQEFVKSKKEVEKRKGNKKGRMVISNVRATYQPETAEEDEGKTNHQVLAMLGMTEKDIRTEEKLGLHSKNVKKRVEQVLEETYGKKTVEEMFDFVNINIHQVEGKLGPSYAKADFDTHMVFDHKPEPRAPLEGELYPVSSFPEHIARVFGDITHLNQLQTKVKDVAYDTDENMLICAPTGAGKTNVALLTILRELNRDYNPLTKTVGDFKVVYISPLKALAAEIVEKFTSKLAHAGVVVKEFTGDLTLTRQELLETHIIVSTPEKWDVMTRKSDLITELVKMIIIDEIHLLDEERGRVLECIVARTLITIERKQKNIRLVGLSATLPNYTEVAGFMQVKKGLFYFSEAYRPVPLYKKYIGVRNPREIRQPREKAEGGEKGKKKNNSRGMDQNDLILDILYNTVKDNMLRREQILIFVHSRKDTIKTGMFLLEQAARLGDGELFRKPEVPIHEKHIVNKDLKALVQKGLGAHNAGMCRKDRKLIENGFLSGNLRVVVCTATLAWGVNLPAHTVIIKGTDIYEPGVGWKDMSILDVQQIFGRAGRPQFDEYGEAILITKIEKLNHFMGMMQMKTNIRSQFEGILLEALNAEISLGNVTTLTEAYEYVKRTFWYVRARKNPKSVGADTPSKADEMIMNLVEEKLDYLHDLRFIRYDKNNLLLENTDLGRICSHYYINCGTMEKFCKYLNFYEDAALGVSEKTVDFQGDIEDQDLLAILAQASEFEFMQVRPDEMEELKTVQRKCDFLEPVHAEYKKLMAKMEKKMESTKFKEFKDEMAESNNEAKQMESYEKVMILIQGYLSMESYDNYSLVADSHYIVQNGTRILRCLFEICLKKNIPYLTMTVLRMCRFIENNIRDDLTPMRMFCFENIKRGILNLRRGQDIKDNKYFLEDLTCKRIENKLYDNHHLYGSIRSMREEHDIGMSLRLNHGEGHKLKKLLFHYPLLTVEHSIKPIAQTILKVDLKVFPEFIYSKQFHLSRENFWIIIEFNGEILHHEEFPIFTKNLTREKHNVPTELSFFVPFKEKAESYMCYIMSDRFVGADYEFELVLKDIMIHTEKMEYTDLLDLRPLRISVLNNPDFESIFKIKFFNPIQTQLFHSLYHNDNNVLIGAPTGSGKTIMAELAILRLFATTPQLKVVYVGPYKALVKERMLDWKNRFENSKLKKKVVELTGDYTPDLEALIGADVLVTTPEKWDGISRNWQNRNYVTQIGLIVFDEIHLLGQDRGPTIEVIVSRMNYISAKLNRKIRMVGLSTAMANGADVANWFGVPKHSMFNFRPNVRPVPVEIHFKGFPEKNYCPRMNSMNKPAFNDIKKFSPHAPVLVSIA